MALHRSVGMGEDAFATFTSMQTIMLCAWHIPTIKESNNQAERQSVFISVLLLLLDPRCCRATGLQRLKSFCFQRKLCPLRNGRPGKGNKERLVLGQSLPAYLGHRISENFINIIHFVGWIHWRGCSVPPSVTPHSHSPSLSSPLPFPLLSLSPLPSPLSFLSNL